MHRIKLFAKKDKNMRAYRRGLCDDDFIRFLTRQWTTIIGGGRGWEVAVVTVSSSSKRRLHRSERQLFIHNLLLWLLLLHNFIFFQSSKTGQNFPFIFNFKSRFLRFLWGFGAKQKWRKLEVDNRIRIIQGKEWDMVRIKLDWGVGGDLIWV